MVKIEKLNTAKAVFTRNGLEQPVFLNSILTRDEFKTLRVLEGTVVVSIDETDVVTVGVTQSVSEDSQVVVPEQVAADTKSPEQSEPAVEAPVTPAPKTIVQPKPRTPK
jgi:hypothetical protein